MNQRIHAPRLGKRAASAQPASLHRPRRGPTGPAFAPGVGPAGHDLSRIRVAPDGGASASVAQGPIQLGNGKKKSRSKIPKSTIHYAERIEEVAEGLGMDVGGLASRKPHTKRGTGSSGTQHDVADARAATRARETVEERIKEKTGVDMSIADFAKQSAKEEATAIASSEKRQARERRAREVAEEHTEAYKDWIASLATESWKSKQKDLGNTYRSAPTGKKLRGLKALAGQLGWETEWEDSMAPHLWE